MGGGGERAMATRGVVDETSTSGGSSDTEVKELAVSLRHSL